MNISGRIRALRARLPRRSSKGAAELGVVFVSASLVLGVLFGNGISKTSLDLSDGLSWLTDEPSGEVIQVNAATGRLETRIDVGDPGDALDIAQYDGRLIVTNRTTGELTSFDMATLLASGQRSVSNGDATTVLRHDDDVFLVDRSVGSISAIDPVTADVIGEVWVSDTDITDAGIDGRGTVWVVDREGLVVGLGWNHDSLAFEKTESRTVKGSGPGSVLVAHARGVTLFGPDNGIVVQVGTGNDVVANAPQLAGQIEKPDDSPHDLVPASSPETGTVVIVGGHDVREVNVATVGCAKPGRPQVYRGVIYVPCIGAGKVILLNRKGRMAGPDILLPDGGEPELVIDDGYLLINVPGAERGVQVMPDGSTRTFLRRDPSVPAQQVKTTTPNSFDLPDITRVADHDRDHGRHRNPRPPKDTTPGAVDKPDPGNTDPSGDPNKPGNPNGPDRPDPSDDPTDPLNPLDPPVDPPDDPPVDPPVDPPPPPAATLEAPTGVSATLLANGSVEVNWSHAGDPAATFDISLSGGGRLATVAGSNRQAVVTGVPAGVSSRFVVTAINGSLSEASSPSNAVTPSDRPGTPQGVTASGTVRVTGKIERATYNASWSPAPDNGSPITGYTVTFTTNDGTRTVNVAATATSASTSWGCLYEYNPDCFIVGDSFSVSVTATNAHGVGPAATASGNAGAPMNPVPPPPPTLPAANRDIVASHAHRWDSASVEGFGTTTLTLAPPADWAGFGGTCSFTYSGGRRSPSTQNIACNATGVSISIRTGYIWEPNSGDVGHSVQFHASNGTDSVNSNYYTWTTTQQTLCEGCQVP